MSMLRDEKIVRTYISRIRSKEGGYDFIRSFFASRAPAQNVVSGRLVKAGYYPTSTWIEGTHRHNEKRVVETIEITPTWHP